MNCARFSSVYSSKSSLMSEVISSVSKDIEATVLGSFISSSRSSLSPNATS